MVLWSWVEGGGGRICGGCRHSRGILMVVVIYTNTRRHTHIYLYPYLYLHTHTYIHTHIYIASYQHLVDEGAREEGGDVADGAVKPRASCWWLIRVLVVGQWLVTGVHGAVEPRVKPRQSQGHGVGGGWLHG